MRAESITERERSREDRTSAATTFLETAWWAHREAYPCWTSASATFDVRTRVPSEIFTAMVILELSKRSALHSGVKGAILALLRRTRTPEGLHHFFLDRDKLPADADCTGIAHSLLWEAGLLSEGNALKTAERIARNTDPRGVLAVYFTHDDDRKHIIDAAVCANALHFLNHVGVPHWAEASEHHLFQTVAAGAYAAGTRYYPAADTFLFFATRLATDFPTRYRGFVSLLRRHVQSQLGRRASPLALAFRALAAERLGLFPSWELAKLGLQQRPDGSWPADAFFRYGRTAQVFGSEMVTTASALAALDGPAPPAMAPLLPGPGRSLSLSPRP
jgi:hypothetical protein